MNKFIAWLLVVFVLFTGMAWADVYRCVSDDGIARYSDQPCASDAELFIKEAVCNIDDDIRRANPFTDLTIKSEDINERLVSHARKLGKCILPDVTFKSYGVRDKVWDNQYHTWSVELYYSNKGSRAKWTLDMNYHAQPKDGDMRIGMRSIISQLGMVFTDQPTLEDVTRLRRNSSGKYAVQ